MKIKLLKISYKNIREMSELEIDLSNQFENKPGIALIQMPNGTGKTTTMELIRYCFNGEAEKLSSEKIIGFKPLRFEAKEGEFSLKLSLDNATIVVGLIINYEKPSIEYYTVNSKKEGGGREKGWHLPREVRAIMVKKFVRLFVFDGELAGQLLTPEMHAAEDAVKSLYQLDKIENLSLLGEELLNIKIQEAQESGVTKEQGVKALQTKLIKVERKHIDLKKRIDNIKLKISDDQSKMEKNGKNIDQFFEETKNTQEKSEKIQGEIINLERGINSDSKEFIEKLKSPANFSDLMSKELNSLAKQMVKLKLPKTQSQEFFKELVESPYCICGRELYDKERKNIMNRADECLTDDNIAVINAIKTAIKDLPQKENLNVIIERLRSRMKNKQKAEQEKLSLKKYLDEVKQAKIEHLQKENTELKREIESQKEILEVIIEDDKYQQESKKLDWEVNVHLCEKEKKKLTKQLTEATNTVRFGKQVNIFKVLISSIKNQSLLELKLKIVEETNRRISQILGSKEIQISSISQHLNLKERKGVSEGQKLSIAYSFLSTLFHESEHELPFIVDTPAGPLDLYVRREVSNTILNLFEQVIIFITSGERNGFVDNLYNEESCKFYTILKIPGGVQLNNSIEFFKKFQSEEDESGI